LIALAGLEVVDAQAVVDELAVVAERQALGQQACIDAFLGELFLDLEMRGPVVHQSATAAVVGNAESTWRHFVGRTA